MGPRHWKAPKIETIYEDGLADREAAVAGREDAVLAREQNANDAEKALLNKFKDTDKAQTTKANALQKREDAVAVREGLAANELKADQGIRDKAEKALKDDPNFYGLIQKYFETRYGCLEDLNAVCIAQQGAMEMLVGGLAIGTRRLHIPKEEIVKKLAPMFEIYNDAVDKINAEAAKAGVAGVATGDGFIPPFSVERLELVVEHVLQKGNDVP
jgi:hypothetical protein